MWLHVNWTEWHFYTNPEHIPIYVHTYFIRHPATKYATQIPDENLYQTLSICVRVCPAGLSQNWCVKESLQMHSKVAVRNFHALNPRGAMSIYIYARARLLVTSMSTYICTQYKRVPTAPSCKTAGKNSCLLSSNKFRPHLSTYVTARKRQEGAVPMREWTRNFTRAIKSEAFSRTNGANSLQFSIKAEVLPSCNLEMSPSCPKFWWLAGKSAPFRSAGKLRV